MKKQIPTQMFFLLLFFCGEFCEIFHIAGFKELFGRLLLHKHLFCLLSHHNHSPFQRRCQTKFPADYILALICRLGTRASSILPTLSLRAIFNPVEYLRWSFFCENSKQLKAVKYFSKKAPL